MFGNSVPECCKQEHSRILGEEKSDMHPVTVSLMLLLQMDSWLCHCHLGQQNSMSCPTHHYLLETHSTQVSTIISI